MKKVYIILYLSNTYTGVHMVTTDKAKAEAELASLNNFDYELREEWLED